MLAIASTALAILLFSVVSNRLRDTIVTAPIVMTIAGIAIALAAGGDVFNKIDNRVIHMLAEITLVLILFSDAARIDIRMLIRDHTLPLRLLAIGMPLTIIAGMATALALPFGLSWAEAALLACVLAPTDAALGQSVLSNRDVPVRIRQALNVESGLNDGIAVPLVVLFAALAGFSHESRGFADHLTFAIKQIAIGPLAGIAIGWIAAKILDTSASRDWMNEAFEGPAILATVALSYAVATLAGGNGFISAFTAGLTFGAMIGTRCKFILEFAESEGQALAMFAFMVFGTVMLPRAVAHMSWAIVLYAVLSLTLIRMIPAAMALAGTGLSPVSVGFLGWFGPRGLASILFGLLIIEQMHTPATDAILAITVTTVAFSILLHGVTAAPLARRYAALTARKGECAENMPASEIPSRTGMVRNTTS